MNIITRSIKFKLAATVMAFIIATACALLLDETMTNSAWGYNYDNGVALIAYGWGIGKAGWPLILFGALFGAWLVFVCIPSKWINSS